MKKAFFLLHLSIALASLTAIFGKLIQLNEIILTWYRLFLAAIILFLISFIFKRDIKELDRKNYLKTMLVGFVLGLHWVFFYASIKYSTISIGVVCFCLTGFFTALLSPLLKREKRSWIELVLSTLTLVGISLIFSFDTQYRLGIGLGVVSSILVALFTIWNEQLAKTFDALVLTKVQMVGGTLGLGLVLPVFLYFNPVEYIIPTFKDFMLLVLLSGFCTVFMYILLSKALKFISAFTVNLNFNLEPLYAIVLAVVFFNEYSALSLSFFAGLLLIVLSLGLQMYRVFTLEKQSVSNKINK